MEEDVAYERANVVFQQVALPHEIALLHLKCCLSVHYAHWSLFLTDPDAHVVKGKDHQYSCMMKRFLAAMGFVGGLLSGSPDVYHVFLHFELVRVD